MKSARPSKTKTEAVASSLPAQSLVAIAAAAANPAIAPIAALLPVLLSSLATRRHEQRVNETLAVINADLAAMEAELQKLTDEQYAVITDIVYAILQTTNTDKLQYLRIAVRNAIPNSDLQSVNVSMISRIIRDISATEISFLLTKFSYRWIAFVSNDPGRQNIQVPDHLYRVDADSADGILVRSLQTLGILEDFENKQNGDPFHIFAFAPITGKIVALFADA